MNPYPRLRHRQPGRRASALTAAAVGLATAAFSLALAGPALASGTPSLVPGHVHTAGRPSPTAGTSRSFAKAAAPQDTTTPTLTQSPAQVPNGSTITFTYSAPAADVNSENWIGIYEPGQTPGDVGSTTWNWAPDASGTLTFSTTSLYGVGPYVAYFFYDNGYSVLAGPADFTVTASKPAPAPQFSSVIGQHGAGALSDPSDVAIAPNHNLWVTDHKTGLVEQFSSAGHYLGSIGAGKLLHPDGVAIDKSGDVWVADTGHDQVTEFSAAGKVLQSFGSQGSGNGQLDQPQGLAFDSAGDVWVADQADNRLEEFSAAGAYLSAVSVASPYALAFDSAGNYLGVEPELRGRQCGLGVRSRRNVPELLRQHPGRVRRVVQHCRAWRSTRPDGSTWSSRTTASSR